MNEVISPKHWDELLDDEIDLSDIPELGDEFFAQAKTRGPLIQKNTVLVDQDVYDWFVAQVPDYPEVIAGLLRTYMEAQKDASIQTTPYQDPRQA